MPHVKKKIIVGIAIVVLISAWIGLSSNPLEGMAVFFVLTVLLWAFAKTRRWI
jgi:hypothetical protein